MASLFGAFQALNPPEPESIVTMVAVHVDGTSTVQDIAGQQYKARGTSVPAGEKAFVKGRVISGQAPNLPYEEITV